MRVMYVNFLKINRSGQTLKLACLKSCVKRRCTAMKDDRDRNAAAAAAYDRSPIKAPRFLVVEGLIRNNGRTVAVGRDRLGRTAVVTAGWF